MVVPGQKPMSFSRLAESIMASPAASDMRVRNSVWSQLFSV